MPKGLQYNDGLDLTAKALNIPVYAGLGYFNGRLIGQGLGFDDNSQERLGRLSAMNAGLGATSTFIQSIRQRREAKDRIQRALADDYVNLPYDPYNYTPQNINSPNFFQNGGEVSLDDLDEVVFDATPDAQPVVYEGPTTQLSGMAPPIQNYNAPKGGTIAVSHNNPGNIKFGSFAAKYGATPGRNSTDGRHTPFAVFPDVETGLQAQRDLLTSKNYRELSVDAAMRRWSNSGYGGEIYPELSAKAMKDLNEQELRELQRRQIKREDVDMYRLIFE